MCIIKEASSFQRKSCKLCEGKDRVCFFTMVYSVPNDGRHRGTQKKLWKWNWKVQASQAPQKKIFLEEANDLAYSSGASIIEKSYLFIKKYKPVEPTLPCANWMLSFLVCMKLNTACSLEKRLLRHFDFIFSQRSKITIDPAYPAAVIFVHHSLTKIHAKAEGFRVTLSNYILLKLAWLVLFSNMFQNTKCLNGRHMDISSHCFLFRDIRQCPRTLGSTWKSYKGTM